ncbi:hypothetical protein COCSUDRAFT_56482 [Coccomyxa subellipsoidea C-169]|uniref:EamA domain-containing protein n=1 Tax=Coccomyxa subellipsoidea (strain C-169) TaxID=574566 RepID=I0YUI1_COCSC|nr:hypothetical protein COCSUDRAFT_56482 [Coccomyxa subellipsoidea C-169]EIE22050.1 hypothetical protein COCSUDRAFT_56482 [Coccomyxa subellipsoidea C-169]|eukprot:XP_005646594.1 hypothetical protein COCSUDRAFT_56482 [Coccomyxa subellipsoidea C-169]
MARVGLEADRFTCCVRPRRRQQQLSNIRFRKGLVYYSRRQLERTKQAVQKIEPAIEAAVQTQGQVVLCASNWVVVKDCEHSFDPFIFALFRFTVAALAFSPFLKKALTSKLIRRGGLELGFWMALGYLTQAQGLITTDASRASFISTFTVLVVPMLAGASGKAHVKPLTYFSALMTLLGVALLVEKGGAFNPTQGDAWSLASAIFFGVQVFRTEIISRRLNKNAVLPLMAAALTTVAGTSLVAAAVTHPQAVQNLLALPAQVHAMVQGGIPWWQIMYTGLMSTDAVLMIEVVALHDVSSTDAAIIYTMEPVLGAGLAYVVLGERWGSLGWVGAALIIASSLAAQIVGTEEAVVPEPEPKPKQLKTGRR